MTKKATAAQKARSIPAPLDDDAFLDEQDRLSKFANTRDRADLERTCTEDVAHLIAIARKRKLAVSAKDCKNHLVSKGMPIGLAAKAARIVVEFIKGQQ